MELQHAWRSLFVLFASLAAAVPPAYSAVGRTPGTASVSADGEAAYSIPIVVPPGTNGMTPNLSLEYRHRTQTGLLGVGWSINGLSQIARCPRTIAQDGILSPVTQTAADRFCLDGQRLVVTNGVAYGSSAAEYRTEIESFARIRSFAGPGVGPQYFTVESPDGRIFEYGATPDSRIDGSAAAAHPLAPPLLWALNRIRDRSGNVIDFVYQEGPGAAFRIASIRYNSNPGAGVASSHDIAFIYESRPNSEVDIAYIAGTPIRELLRLDRIEVRYNGAVLRRYKLNYEPALTESRRSRLASVQECAQAGADCLAPTTFTWQNGAPGFLALAAFASTMPGNVAWSDQLWQLIDMNGDGRSDIVWSGGSTLGASTIRYRLGRASGGFGPEFNTNIASPYGPGVPFDYNGDARDDLLMISVARTWTIVPGGATGFGAPVSTGFGVPPQIPDYRGADINGDGLGDIVWSEIPAFSGNSLAVRARLALAGSGFSAVPLTLYDQAQTMAYETPQGGQFIGPPGRRIDLDGNGAEELLMNENYTIARISSATHATDHFDGAFTGAVAFDFNGDGCSDFAYKHYTGTLRIRIGGCGVPWSGPELLGPAMTAYPVYLQAQDWNNDGREDILLRGTSTWHLAVSNGDSVQPIVDTGVPHDGVSNVRTPDINGDGLRDLAWFAGGQFRHRLRNGPKPDLMLAAVDGFGNRSAFSYRPLTDDTVYLRGSGAIYPLQDRRSSTLVVSELASTDGSGTGTARATSYAYEGLRHHLLGRGSLGFAKRKVTDLTASERNRVEEMRRQDFPYTGLPASVVERQESGAQIASTVFNWTVLDLGTGPAQRRYPRLASQTHRRFHVGGALNGTEISRLVRTIAAVDPASGLTTDETTTVTEVSGGEHAGAVASLRSLRSGILNDATNWCLGRPQALQVMASHSLTGGGAITRNASQTWDSVKCRPTRQHLEPGDSQMQVTYGLAYDAFGNLAGHEVTGAGMSTRTTALHWGDRGQLPATITNPAAQRTKVIWNPSTGQPLELIDPNALKVTWTYDTFGHRLQEIQPDGTRTTWIRSACASGCAARARYRVIQHDRDASGAIRVTTHIDHDQHDRAFRIAMQQPAGGLSVALVDVDARGRIQREYLPFWDGGAPGGYWHYAYDSIGRPTEAALHAGSGSVNRTLRLRYDGLAMTQTDALGRTTTGTRTAWGKLAQVVDAAGNRTRYEHDAFGNLVQVRDALGTLVDTIGYNARGLKVSHKSKDMGAWTWTRNALGEATAMRDAKSQVFGFAYDKLGRLTSRTAPDGVTTWNWGSTAASRNIGRLAGRASPGYSESFLYDAAGRPSARTIVTNATYRYDYTYDSFGLLDVLTYPATSPGNRFAIRHQYDAGRLTQIRDAASPFGSIWRLGARDASGNAIDETLGASIRVITGFHPLSNATEYSQTTVGSNEIQKLSYTWDAADNLVRRQDAIRGLTEDFRYDVLDRLDDSRRNGVINLDLDYDVTGNIRWKSDVCPTSAPCYSYHATRKHAVTAAGSQTYTYDANGNMKRRSGAAIAWTSGNLPRSIYHTNGNRSQFWYGAAGNRWKQVANHAGTTETTFYAGELTEKFKRGGTTTWRQYVAAPNGTIAVRLQSGGAAPSLRYLTHDPLGSTDRILNAAGVPVAAESFAPFGKHRSPSWTGMPSATELATMRGITPDGFTAHEHLDNLDLIHMNGRVYDPHLGRFISADPFVSSPYDGQSLNRYSYVWNNPLSFVDPSGFNAETPCMVTQSGACARVTVIGLRWGTAFHFVGGSGFAQAESASQRDPCGQDSSTFACAMQNGTLVSPSQIVLTAGTKADPTLSRNPVLDYLQGAAARIGNIAMSSSPVSWLFGAHPDFEWFDVPDSQSGQAGAQIGDVGYLVGGAAGVVRKAGTELVARTPSAYARSMQGTDRFPGVDKFKDITLKKGTVIYGGIPGQSAFYTTSSAMRRAGYSASALASGLQTGAHPTRGIRTRFAAYEVVDDTAAAFGLALANTRRGAGWYPQIVVPSFQTSLRLLDEIPLGP
jgi:RHS repeat-associated protein